MYVCLHVCVCGVCFICFYLYELFTSLIAHIFCAQNHIRIWEKPQSYSMQSPFEQDLWTILVSLRFSNPHNPYFFPRVPLEWIFYFYTVSLKFLSIVMEAAFLSKKRGERKRKTWCTLLGKTSTEWDSQGCCLHLEKMEPQNVKVGEMFVFHQRIRNKTSLRLPRDSVRAHLPTPTPQPSTIFTRCDFYWHSLSYYGFGSRLWVASTQQPQVLLFLRHLPLKTSYWELVYKSVELLES